MVPEVTLDQVVNAINDILEGPWGKDEIIKGKNIIFPLDTLGGKMMSDAMHSFRDVGWKVDRLVELSSPGSRIYYLKFINPNWKKKDCA
ncbi:MAG: hypothetical protein CME70_14020 [Halobacteriovorax sp.]|nr:hypothetical protein [Halobacteriovorax sp.]|tara:strand:+ start:265 stop:531 length:267 start_codon:yes stop_codon:yes gene_type:complete